MTKRSIAATMALGLLVVLPVASSRAHLVTESWSARSKMPVAREGTAGAFIGGKLYVSHGSLPGGAGIDSAQMASYDPTTNIWTTLASASAGRAELVGAAVGGIFYAIGGRNKSIGAPCGTAVCSAVEAYNPATNTWSTKTAMPTARAGIGAAVVGGKIYVVGRLL